MSSFSTAEETEECCIPLHDTCAANNEEKNNNKPVNPEEAHSLLEPKCVKELQCRSYNSILKLTFDGGENLLHVACRKDNISAETMKHLVKIFDKTTIQLDECLKISRLHEVNDEHQEPLHIAAYNANHVALNELLKNIKQENKNRRCRGETALTILVKNNKNSSEKAKESLKCLLKHDLDLNKLDMNNKIPLFWALVFKHKHFSDIIIDHLREGKQTINIKGNEKCQRAILRQYSADDPKKIINTIESNWEKKQYIKCEDDRLFSALLEKNIKELKTVLNKSKGKLVNYDNQSHTLLQLACENNLKEFAEYILRTDGVNPNLRIQQNQKSPIEIALDKDYTQIIDLLLQHKLIKIPITRILKDCYKIDWEIHQKKLDCLIKILKYEIEHDGSPLMYVNLEPEIAIKFLTANKVSLAQRNRKGELISKYCELDTLKGYFDYCIEEDVAYDMPEDQYIKNYNVKFNFKPLLPPTKTTNVIEPINSNHTGSSSYHKHETIMDLNVYKETDAIYSMSMSEKQKSILKHPIVTSFLEMKWRSMKWIFWINLFIYIFFCISLYSYVYCTCLLENDILKIISHVSLIMFLSILIIREMIEMLLLCKNCSPKYFTYLENIFELVLLFSTVTLLLPFDYDNSVKKTLSIIIVLLSSVGLLLALERIPQCNMKMAMLKRVTLNILRTFILYSIFFIPFALSFTLLYKKEEKDTSKTMNFTSHDTNDTNSENSKNYFDTMPSSMFKTVVMMTGEYELNETINLTKYPILSSILFLLFVFCVAIVGFNLLTGLAVSDTREIVNEAELLGLIAKTNHICYIESLLPGLIKFFDKFNCTKGKIRKSFYLAPSHSEISVHPHDKGRISALENSQNDLDDEQYLGEKIAREALMIVQKKKEKERRRNRLRLENLEKENLGLKNTIMTLKKHSEKNVKLKEHKSKHDEDELK